jgi:dTMP kinase
MGRGIIISFEGIDGCGKTTQAKSFYLYLKNLFPSVIHLVEPGGTETGEKIRKVLLDKKEAVHPYCELFLYFASRAQLLGEKIKPAVDKGKIIVLDRYIDSTVAYQGYGRELSVDFIEKIHRMFVGEMFPDITFLVDEKPENLKNILDKKDKDRIEEESIEFQKRVREGYLKIAGKNNKRIKIINRGKIEETFEKIKEEWNKFYAKRRN